MDTPELREEFLKLQANDSMWTMQNMTVQVPAVNATNMARHHLGLAFVSIGQSSFLQRITQPKTLQCSLI